MTSIPCGRAPCSITHTNTHKHKHIFAHCSLQNQWKHSKTVMHVDKQQMHTTQNCRPQKKQKPRQAGKQTRKVSQEVEESTLLCLQVCEALKNEIKETGTERMFEKQQHTNTALVLSLCMLCMMANHDYHT